MLIDLASSSSKERYQLLTQAVVPRPIAWVLSDSGEGRLNLAPFSYFTVVSSDPPLLMISVGHKRGGDEKDTRVNLQQRDHFVVHIAHEELLDPLNESARALDHGVSELDASGLETTAFDGFSLPRIKACRLALGCRLHRTIVLEDASPMLMFGRIERVYVDDELVASDSAALQIDARALNPVARLGGNEYSTLGKVETVPRPG